MDNFIFFILSFEKESVGVRVLFCYLSLIIKTLLNDRGQDFFFSSRPQEIYVCTYSFTRLRSVCPSPPRPKGSAKKEEKNTFMEAIFASVWSTSF